jgi:hypothetical protein
MTVTASIAAQHPDGTQCSVDEPITFRLDSGTTRTRLLTQQIPVAVPPTQFGVQRLVGRISTPGFGHFDEDEVRYTLLP